MSHAKVKEASLTGFKDVLHLTFLWVACTWVLDTRDTTWLHSRNPCFCLLSCIDVYGYIWGLFCPNKNFGEFAFSYSTTLPVSQASSVSAHHHLWSRPHPQAYHMVMCFSYLTQVPSGTEEKAGRNQPHDSLFMLYQENTADFCPHVFYLTSQNWVSGLLLAGRESKLALC